MTKVECEVETSKAIMGMRNQIEELETEISVLLSCKNCPDNKGGLLSYDEELECMKTKSSWEKIKGENN